MGLPSIWRYPYPSNADSKIFKQLHSSVLVHFLLLLLLLLLLYNRPGPRRSYGKQSDYLPSDGLPPPEYYYKLLISWSGHPSL